MSEKTQQSNLQRTPEWYESRRGMFTSSRIHELMGQKGLGKTGETYAFEMAVDIAEGWNMEESYVSFDMQRGIDTEPLAFAKFSDLMSLNFVSVEPCGFFALNEFTGGSPDGLVGDDGVLEIKCPKPETFFRVVLENYIDPKYYDQIQHQMLVTGRTKGHYFVYCIYNGVEKWHHIEVSIDQERHRIMIERIKEAKTKRDEFVKQLLENRQY